MTITERSRIRERIRSRSLDIGSKSRRRKPAAEVAAQAKEDPVEVAPIVEVSPLVEANVEQVPPVVEQALVPPRVTKTDQVVQQLQTDGGVTISEIMEQTGWQAHSVRGFFSAVVRKKLALDLVSSVGEDGERRYRIEQAAA